VDAVSGRTKAVLSAPKYEFDIPEAMAVDGTRVVVANFGGIGGPSSLTVVDGLTGRLVRVV